MKRNIILIAAFAAMAMTSCKKDYTCECIVTDEDGDEWGRESTTISNTKSKAKDECSAMNDTEKLGAVTFTQRCNIK